jgi:uncharacterized repeat protein (TIGR01451 family)
MIKHKGGEKNVKKQLITLTLTLAFILIFSGTVSAADWTVGPTGNYQTIQGAVDGSSDNDTITVNPNGTDAYTENIVVNKTSLLIKANGTVTVQPKEYLKLVFTIDSKGNNSIIQGFNIRSGGYDNNYFGIGLIETSGCRVTGNNILNANQAIYADRCTNITIDGNTITNSYSVGIHVINSPGSSNNKALNNTLTGNRDAIVWYGTNNGEISGNIIQNSTLVGMYLHNSLNNLISGNTVTGTQTAPGSYNCNGDGIYLETVSNNNTISGNTISNNVNNGIHFWNGCNYNTISGNAITNNGNGIYLYGSLFNSIISGNNVSDNSNVGIYIYQSAVNNIENNIANNNGYGIYVYLSQNNLIQGNILNGNTLDGLTLDGEQTDSNTVTGNTITGNHRYGIISNSGGNSIHYNRISGNYNYQMFNRRYAENAQYNWWGSNDNPFTSGKFGGEEPDLINYSPWIYMTITTNSTTINNGETSLITVSFNNQFDGETVTALNPDEGHILDGTPVTFNTDLGSIGSKTIQKQTSNGIATATLTANETAGTAHVNAVTDSQIVNVDVTINPKSSLYLTITPSKANPFAGDTVIYTLKVGNKGPDKAKDVVMTYVVPEGLEFAGANVDVGTYTYNPTNRTITWTIGDVPKGDPYMWLSLLVAQEGQYLINPTLSTSSYDPTLNNNIQSITVNAAAAQTSNTVNAASNTVGMQKTGMPIAGLILALLALFGGLATSKRK